MNTTSETDFLRLFFETLNRRGIEYAVLRNYEQLPCSTGGSDIDIWVPDQDYEKMCRLIEEVGHRYGAFLVSNIVDFFSPKKILLSNQWGIQFDINRRIAHRSVSYIPEDVIREYVEEYNGVKVLSPRLDGIICFLKETLNNKRCRTEYHLKVRMAIKDMGDEELMCILRGFPLKARFLIVAALRGEAFDEASVRELGEKVAGELMGAANKWRHTKRQIGKLRRLWKQPGYTIAFLGTDGAGKSTIIEGVMPALKQAFHNSVHYEHMRPNYIPSLAVLTGKRTEGAAHEVCTNPHGAKPSGAAGSFLRLVYYWIDYTYGYYRKIYASKSTKSTVWLFDRYFHDFVMDSLRARISLPQWILRAFERITPMPDLTICVGTDPKIIHKRKPELPIEEVERQVEELRRYAARHRERAVWVDTGCSAEESTGKTMEAIIEMMSKRFDEQ